MKFLVLAVDAQLAVGTGG